MDSLVAAGLAVFVLGIALLSARLDRGPVTLPMLAVAAGMAMGPSGLGLLHVTPERGATRIVLELTLILVLLTSGAEVDLTRIRGGLRWPLRLILIALPGSLVLGTLLGRLLFPSLSLFGAMILAGIVAPTDDEVRRPAVAGESFPEPVRQALNLEGGLSDGILVAFLAATLAYTTGTETPALTGRWLAFALRQLGVGVAGGVALGLAGAWLIQGRRFSAGFLQLATVALAVLAYALTARAGGSGFTAVFCAGAALGNVAPQLREEVFSSAWAQGRLLVLVSFAVFGAVAVIPALRMISWPLATYAALTLTAVRAVPVALSVAGTGVRRLTVAFVSWFGTRGIGSILFGLLLLERARLPGERTILAAMTLTVLASIVLHGITGWPANRAYLRQLWDHPVGGPSERPGPSAPGHARRSPS